MGLKLITNEIKYTCIRSGKKLIWDKGVKIQKISSQSSKTGVKDSSVSNLSLCDLDSRVPTEWAQLQLWMKNRPDCPRPYRYVQATPTSHPKSIIPSLNPLPISSCKIDDPIGRPHIWQTFRWQPHLFRPTVSANIQVIPLQFTDLRSDSNPISDYQKYFEFLRNFLINSSDVKIEPSIQIPEEYFQVGYPSTKYELNNEHKGGSALLEDIENLVASKLNLADVDLIIFVVPITAELGQVSQKLNFGDPQSPIFKGKAIYLQGSINISKSSRLKWTPDPWVMVHEAIGHSMGLDDHFGGELFRPDQLMPAHPKDLGTGQWGNMSGVNGDFLIWDKWTVGWVSDSQIACVDPKSQATISLTPSTMKSDKTKAVVIPLSSSRGIVVESQRSVGYNFKYPKESNGALIYAVDMTEIAAGSGAPWGYGVYVQRPASRPANVYQNGFTLGDAALKVGESLVVEGVKISVVEAGDFGDVIQING